MASKFQYTLDLTQQVNWTATQEKAINGYPFDLDQELDVYYIARTYLQFLWLPESIMPLTLLVPSLLRAYPDHLLDDTPHPLHFDLNPLLLTARSASNKYHTELPQILTYGSGAQEDEEAMMWYALDHEQADDDLWARIGSTGEGPWVDEQWRTAWLERLEKREFQIQILLYFLKLSLPGPAPPPDSPKKGKRLHKVVKVEAPTISVEDRLESFMDKLSMWQLVDGLGGDSTKRKSKEDARDWMQVFFEDLVCPQFEKELPQICALLRSKIFPDSPFSSSSASSSSSSPSSSRATSPDLPQKKKHTSKAGPSRHPSPALSTTSVNGRPLARSRSLSITLAQERERERERSVGIGATKTKKRVLNREISMSRTFKPKAKPSEEVKHQVKKEPPQENVKVKDEGVTLVDATPVKSKTRQRSNSYSTFSSGPFESQTRGSFTLPAFGDEGDEDEVWNLPSSPDILLLGGGSTRKKRLPSLSDKEDLDSTNLGTSTSANKLGKRPRLH